MSMTTSSGCSATKGEMFNDLRMSILPGTDQDKHCVCFVSRLRIRKGKMLDLRTAFPLYAYVDEDGGQIGMEALPLRGLHRPCRVGSDCFSHRRHHHRRHIGICNHPISTSAKPFSAPLAEECAKRDAGENRAHSKREVVAGGASQKCRGQTCGFDCRRHENSGFRVLHGAQVVNWTLIYFRTAGSVCVAKQSRPARRIPAQLPHQEGKGADLIVFGKLGNLQRRHANQGASTR